MRAIGIAVVVGFSVIASSALAGPQKAPVGAPSAGWSARHRGMVVVRADVSLTNGCWSDPRLEPMFSGNFPVTRLGFAAMADNNSRPGQMCSMIFRKVTVCTEARAPAAARAVVVVGSDGRLSTAIRRTAPDCQGPRRPQD